MIRTRPIPLSDPGALGAGGKSRGLHLLLDAGVRVPDGCVIVDADDPCLDESLREYLAGRFDLERDRFAVRSSGLDEDGANASFAGQYETILGVQGLGALHDAIAACRGSAHGRRVREYAARTGSAARSRIPVIVQRMVDARCAGVLFTADPVTNRRDRIVINAVDGVGERLVGGTAAGDQHVLTRGGREISADGGSRLLGRNELDTLRREALLIEAACGFPADLEWAIDRDGTLWWLQLRPITTLAAVHVNELDTPPVNVEEHLLTRCNVGEMMPGPVTPLSWSVFGRGIDVGLQDFLVRLRVQDRVVPENRFIFMFYNHLFIDMTALYDIPKKVAFTTKADIETSISGRALDGAPVACTRSLPVRARNFLCYVGYFMSAARRLRALRRLVAGFAVPRHDDAAAMYRAIDDRLPHVFDAWAHHYVTSAKSGTLNSALLRILDADGAGTMQDHLGTLSGLLIDLGGVNGAQALEELDCVEEAIRRVPTVLAAFRHDTAASCLGLLRAPASGEPGRLFRRFLRHHGHRCVREAELREKSWESDPESLVRLLQRNLVSGGTVRRDTGGTGPDTDAVLSMYSGKTRLIVRRVLPSARRYVVARENSKSLCIRIQDEFRKAYLHLGARLVAEGLLDDVDEVFFLTHQELGRLVSGRESTWRATAKSRRDLFPTLFDMQFDDFSVGTPEPSEPEPAAPLVEGVLRGVPVSAGVVTGRARIINSLTDAETLRPGDIMIASYTDVGWTPYFSTIAGLVTEIGSTLSHGAVVAREYGVPAVVSVRGARHHIRTGDLLTIDGHRGTVEVHAVTEVAAAGA